MYHRPVGIVVKDIAIGAGGLGFDSRSDRIGHLLLSPTAHHRCYVSMSPRRYAAEMGPNIRYTLRRNSASIIKN